MLERKNMTNLITEARKLCEKFKIQNQEWWLYTAASDWRYTMRLIDKDAILHDLENGVYPASMTYTLTVDIAKGLIEYADTIDAVPVVRGRWTQTNLFDEEANVYVCSVCGEPWTLNAGTPQENNMNFCPNCGCDMRGERDGEK